MKSPAANSNLPATQLSLLPQYVEARQMLARATRFEDVKSIRDKAEALRAYAAAIKDVEMEVQLGELKMHAQRRAGQMLLDGRQNGTRALAANGRPKSISAGNAFAPTLKDLGISALEAHRWQKIAFLSDDAFENRLLMLRKLGVRPTTNAFLDTAFSSETNEWLTPKEVLRAVVNVLGEIDLDPCSDPKKNVPANCHFTEKDDGLSQPWHGRVFMNPPYGDAVSAWVERLVMAYSTGEVTEAIALVAARVDTAWFAMFEDPVVCFVTGRLHFSGHAAGAPFPSAAIYLGNKKRNVFARRFARLGSIWTRIPIANPEKD